LIYPPTGVDGPASLAGGRRKARYCPSIGSGNDTRFTSDEDPFDLETFVENDDIRSKADVEATDVRQPERARRDGGRRPAVLNRRGLRHPVAVGSDRA
jgi:hypothetical protein